MTSDVGAQLRKGVVEYCILGLLATEPTYGWQLSETLVSRGMIASIGTLYPILSRLRAQGLVSSFDRMPDRPAATTASPQPASSSSRPSVSSGSRSPAP